MAILDSVFPLCLFKILMSTVLPSRFLQSPSSHESVLEIDGSWRNLHVILFVLGFFSVAILRLRGRILKLPPGPPRFPFVGNWLQIGDDLDHRKLGSLAKKYGDIFFLKMGSRKIVVISSPELAKEVLHTKGVEFASRMGNLVNDIFTGNGQDMVYTMYGDNWRRMRRIMTVPFCTNKVVQESRAAWEEEINMAVNDVILDRESFTSGIVLWNRLQLIVYNVIYRMMFDKRFSDENDPLYVELVSYNTERSRLAHSFDYNYVDFMPIFKPFLKGYLKQCQDIQDRQLEFFRECFVEERRKRLASAEGTDRIKKCAIDRILRDQMNNEIKESSILYLIESINVQAIDTILCSMEWLIAEIINHQEVQDRLRDELDTVLGEAALTEPDIFKLPYLRAVVKESLRLHMPIPLLMPHMNLKQEKLGKYDIPAGTKVLVNAWWIANDPEIWDNPHRFLPDRFMKEDIESNGTDFRYLPFGSGRRCCPGSILALPLLALVVGRLVQTYELLPGHGIDAIDMTELERQSRLQLLNHSLVRVRVRA